MHRQNTPAIGVPVVHLKSRFKIICSLRSSASVKRDQDDNLLTGHTADRKNSKLFPIPEETSISSFSEESCDICSPSSYASSKWNRRREKSLQDAKAYRELLLQKAKKKAQRLSSQGRRNKINIENQSFEDLTSMEYHKKILSMLGSNLSERVDLFNIVTIQMAYLASLMTVETTPQFLTATTQMLVSVVCGTDLIDLEALKNIWISNAMENQSLDTMRSALERFRQGFIALESVPMWQQISRAFTLAAMVGFLPEKIEGDTSSLITMGLNRWTKNLHNVANKTSVFDLILDSTIFACDFCNAVKTGCIKHMFSPDDVTLRATWLIANTDAYLNGMLPEGETADAFLYKTRQCISDINILMKQSSYSGMLLVLGRFRTQLITFLAEAEALAAVSELRPAAPIIYLYGESQIGKSGLMNAVAFMIGKNNNFPVEQENFHYMSVGDKYDSGYTGIKTVIFQDDCGAEHEKYRDATNVTSDIKHSNTVPYYSVQADITGKGKIPFRNYLKIKSGNTRDGGLLNDLSYPLAGTNRIWFFEVRLKPQFSDSQGRFKGISDNDYLDPNVHEIRPYWFVNTERKQTRARDKHDKSREKKDEVYEPNVKLACRYGEWISTPEFLQLIDRMYKEKMAGGKQYVKQIVNMRNLEVCSTCSLFKAPGYCMCTEIENQFGTREVIDVCMNTVLVNVLARLPDIRQEFINPFIYRRVHRIVDGIGSAGVTFVLQATRVVVGSHLLTSWCLLPVILNLMIILRFKFTAFGIVFDHWSFVSLILLWAFLFWCFLRRIREVYTHYLARELMNSTTSVVSIGLRVASMGVVISGAFMALWRMRGLLRFENQGNLQPRCKADIEERSKEVNPWVDVKAEELITRDDSIATMTQEQVLEVVSRNVVRVECYNGDHMFIASCGLMLCNNTLIFPTHALSQVTKDTVFRILRNTTLGGVLKDIRYTSRYDMPNDFSLLVLSKSPSFRNLMEFFPEDIYTGKGFSTMITRDKDLDISSLTLEYQYIRDARNATHTYHGSMGRASGPVFKGMCASPVILASCPSKIVSLHCGGGVEIKNYAASFAISQKMIKEGLEALEKNRMESHGFPGDRPFVASGLNIDPYGDKILEIEKELHERDCVLYTYPSTECNDYCVSIHGSDKSFRSRPFSQVKVSPLACLLEKHGKKRNYGPTPFKADRNYSAAWQVITDGGVYIPQNYLSMASADYLGGLLAEIDRLQLFAEPLDMEQAINGIPGSKFIKRLDMKTSPGAGLGSPKALHFHNVSEEDMRPNYVAEEYVQHAIEWVESELEQGRVPEMLSKTALKDEPTKLTKDKVRVFCACSLPLNIVIRKYLLPILNNLYYIPFSCEMAQGINCTNDEWHQLGSHIREYGEHTCIAGDFSGYDARQTGQIQRATAWVFARLALAMGYSPRDADKVELLVMSLSAKYVLWNGTLVHIDGFMLSGSPVTIAINGIDNAIYHRLAYFHEIVTKDIYVEGSFRDNVRVMFVGDDSIGSSKLDWYNMGTLQRVFAQYGVKYTDAQKNLVATPFIHFDDMDFCKRNFRFEEYVQRYVAPIKIDSIYKSLFCYRESRTSEHDIMISVLRGAARELARHPKHIFDAEMSIIRQVASEYGIYQVVAELHFTYDYWWREVFRLDYDSNWTIDSIDLSGSVSPMGSLDYGLVEEE